MATKKIATTAAAAPAITPEMMAAFQTMLAAQAAGKPAPKAQAKATAVDPQAVIDAALESAGVKVTRFGTQPAKLSKTGKTVGRWVDAKINGVRFQGNLIIAIK